MYMSDIFGVQAQQPSYGVAAPTQGIGVSVGASGLASLLDPGNPLMWFGLVLGVTVGAIGVAGSVRLGGAKVSASIDKG
jgi:uncharacterized membrane protein YedE/YeeE